MGNSAKLEQLERLRSEISPAAPWLPIIVIHIRSQVKTTQSQNYKFKKNAKNSNFEILLETLHSTHLLKLLDKMYKYEMDQTRTAGNTEQTRDAGCWTDRVKPIYIPTTSLCWGWYNNHLCIGHISVSLSQKAHTLDLISIKKNIFSSTEKNCLSWKLNEWYTTALNYLGMRFFTGMQVPKCLVNTMLSNTILSCDYQLFAYWFKMFFWIRVKKSMLSLHAVLEICGLKIVISLNFALNSPHINSLRPGDAYMRQWPNHHWFR